MTRRTLPRFALLASLLAGAACSDGTGPDEAGPDPAVMAGIIAGSGTPGVSGTTACPAGGEMVHDFQANHTIVGDILDATIDATMEFRGCAHAFRDKTFTIDGNSHLEGQNKLRIVAGGLAELIESRGHQVGSHRVRGDGYDRTCSFDLRTTIIPAQGIRELAGTMCGRAIRINLPDLGP